MKLARIAITGTLVLAFCPLGAGCAKTSQATEDSISASQVAAEVDGVEISEKDVSARISAIRSSCSSYSDDTSWHEYLSNLGYDEESFREKIIDEMVDAMVIERAAEDQGIEASETEVEDRIDAQKSSYSDDSTWCAALSAAGLDTQSYRDKVVETLLKEKLIAKMVPEQEPTDAQIQDYFDGHASAYAGKRSSQILISGEDKQQAEDILARINASSDPLAVFSILASEYSQDKASAAKGGDMGWDKIDIPSTTYENALSKLDVGQVSGLVRDDYGYHIIICTDSFEPTPGDEVDTSDVPDEISDVLTSRLEDELHSEAVNAYLQTLHDEANITIYDSDGNAI